MSVEGAYSTTDDSDDPGPLIAVPSGSNRLPPLNERRGMPKHGDSPRKEDGVEYAMDTIISVPEGRTSSAKQTDPAMISVPSHRGDRGVSETSSSGRSIDLIIYLMDKSGLQFTIEDGHGAEAGELFENVMEELRLPDIGREVFSLWLVSDLLELQLKPNHIPFKLACYWEELLEKYTSAPEEDIERDEPILMFQRNVFFPRAKEREINDTEILRLLYLEAKENVIDSRYPVTPAECDYLAGLQALITFKNYSPAHHSPEHYKKRTHEFYPGYMCKSKWSLFSSKSQPEDRLSYHHREAHKAYGAIDNPTSVVGAYKKYLNFCWKLPYYGAAFFRGQIEHPSQGKSAKDDPVFIAINPDGVFIIDMDDVTFLLGLTFQEMSWEYAEPNNRENRNCLPCLFLQFSAPEEERGCTKVFQVFSREAIHMDALIQACHDYKKATNYQTDKALKKIDEDGDGIIKSDEATWRQFNRLCLATFKDGQCVKTSVKAPPKKA